MAKHATRLERITFVVVLSIRGSLLTSDSAVSLLHSYPGVLFLQYGDETRRVHITHELSSLDTLHALIVHMFPQKLTAGMLKSPNTAILIKDEARNVFYELEDVRDIQDRSIIKIYRKEPIYASYPAAAHLANGDLRVRRREGGGVNRANQGNLEPQKKKRVLISFKFNV